MGRSRAECAGALRFSLGWSTTDEEIEHALDVVPGAVARLRAD
jgi:cysteine sulfinate desulfinase/cysteine desulfurase-like protein